MPTCCPVILQTFVNETTTAVPYTGERPTVTVSYLVDGVWHAAGVATVIQVTSAEVTVNHSSPSTGVIKLVQ